MRTATIANVFALTVMAFVGTTGACGSTPSEGTGGATTTATSAGGHGGMSSSSSTTDSTVATATTTFGDMGGFGGMAPTTAGTGGAGAGGSASGSGGATSGTGGQGGMAAGTGGMAASGGGGMGTTTSASAGSGGMGGMPAGSGGMGGMGSSSSSSSSSGNPGDICSVACQAQHDLGCVISTFDCIVTCQAVQASNHACAAELQTYYACYADHVGELSACTMPDACVPAFGNILFCVENYCSTAACDHQESICTCPGICNNHAVISVCDGAECTCFVNGAVAGKCTDFSVPICGLKESCCTVLYFLD